MACFCLLLGVAQPVIKTAVDKNEILIGDQFKLTIQATFSADDYKIAWPAIPDSIQHFEVVSRSNIDSLYSNSMLTGLSQTLTLTSFDSGKWTLPPFLVSMVPLKADSTISFFTDSVPVTVSFSTSDTTNRLRDIKTIRDVPAFNPVWYWVGAAVLLIALIAFLIWFYRYWKKNKGSIPRKAKTTAFDEAMEELNTLKTHNLTIPAEIKIVHTRLGEILKRYLTRTQKDNYRNKTTGDTLIMLRDGYLDKDMLAKAAASLRNSDVVKFAKYLPAVSESEINMRQIKEVIQAIHAAKMVEVGKVEVERSKLKV